MSEVTGWVSNVKTFTIIDENDKEYTALLIYLMQEDGSVVSSIYI